MRCIKNDFAVRGSKLNCRYGHTL